jgi:hypothetical protein
VPIGQRLGARITDWCHLPGRFCRRPCFLTLPGSLPLPRWKMPGLFYGRIANSE